MTLKPLPPTQCLCSRSRDQCEREARRACSCRPDPGLVSYCDGVRTAWAAFMSHAASFSPPREERFVSEQMSPSLESQVSRCSETRLLMASGPGFHRGNRCILGPEVWGWRLFPPRKRRVYFISATSFLPFRLSTDPTSPWWAWT